ncbi:MAG: sulfatase [Chloroflexi bacterium]|nr:sulfatase [Chloroflexota bacterium]
MPPNVLIVTTHDTGRFIQPYGVTTVQTPTLNRLAAEGARFNAYTTAPQCSPSRASLTTGRYPHCNGTMGLTHRDFRWDLNPGERTIPQILRTAGYRSGHWGVEHAARDPRRIGNDVTDETREVDAIVAGVSRFIDADPTRPFVVQVGFGETHRVGGHGFGGQPYDKKGITVPPYLVDAPDTRADLADFQGCVNRADDYIGRLVAILEERNLLDQTLVLYVGDHGIAFPRAKCTLYDPGIEISLIARLPGSPLSGGVAPRGMASTMDVVPTLIELTGAQAPPNLHGTSLLPMAAGTSPGYDEIFIEKTYHSYYDPMRGIRTNRWKYIRNFETGLGVEIPSDIAGSGAYRDVAGRLQPSHHVEVELYDLQADPTEQTNLANRPETRAIQTELGAKVIDWMRATNDPLLDGPVQSPFYRDTMSQISG